ncbi:beta-ketoacyl synthase N-terminal-like domain-containing protein [Streptomyces eurocidicus]|uniref:3-oxoacyl-(Acyl-carrier-protein) synthase n=1 Tax=Streptomyces eurocidicus TaxID=66423 RepID=A0A7W8B970_STREU|nr:beta-ketoacyl synthase N-terminal-like domain-containing protein [Streptomyces eurocidicus]MBB5119107.1 3-oxoacyl-(acyl-carrier-protein) synthase [Streptomyces eurocidicus]
MEAVVTVLALRDQTLPPTAGFTGVDPKCGLDSVPLRARRQPMDVALSNNFAFAGANATVAFARPGTSVPAPPEARDESVVVTGIGVVTAGGQDPDALWEKYRAGVSPGGPYRGLRAAPVEFDPGRWIPPRERRRMDRLGLLAVAACHEALVHAGLDAHDRVGVVLGTGLGPMRSTEEFYLPVLASGSAAASPAVFPNTVFNAAAGQVAMVLGAKGPTSTVTAGHAAGASALSVAYDLLRACGPRRRGALPGDGRPLGHGARFL